MWIHPLPCWIPFLPHVLAIGFVSVRLGEHLKQFLGIAWRDFQPSHTAGVIRLPLLLGIKQLKFRICLKDFPFNSALFGLGFFHAPLAQQTHAFFWGGGKKIDLSHSYTNVYTHRIKYHPCMVWDRQLDLFLEFLYLAKSQKVKVIGLAFF